MDTNERNFRMSFFYPAHHIERREQQDYVPSYEREGYHEGLVEVLPSYGMQAQPGKSMGEMRWARGRERRPETT